MENHPREIDLERAYRVLLQAYIRNHSLYEGQKVQYRCGKQWADAVVTSIGSGSWDDRVVQILSGDGLAMEVHSTNIRVLP